MMAAPAASASLTEPKTVEELSSTLLSSLPSHDDLKTGVTSDCFKNSLHTHNLQTQASEVCEATNLGEK